MKFIDDIENQQYTNFIIKNKYGSLLQSIEWQEIKKDWLAKRVAVLNDSDEIVACAQILVRQGLWYLPRGPVLDYDNKELLNFFLENIKIYAKKNKSKLLKIDIPKPIKDENLNNFKSINYDTNSDDILRIFKNNKFKHTGFSLNMSHTIQPRFTTETKLSDIIPDMFSKDTRRLIRDADKKFVEVKRCGIEKIDDLIFALECTEKRKQISLRSKTYFENLIKTFGENCLLYISYININKALSECEERKNLLLAEIDSLGDKMPKKKRTLQEQISSVDKLIELFKDINISENKEHVISAAITIAYGHNAEILYAGMDDTFSKLPAQYKVFSETMRKAQEMGVDTVSMGGIEGDLNDSLLGFKSKFSPNIVEYYGEFDFTFSKIYSLMYNYGLPLRRKILKFIKNR